MSSEDILLGVDGEGGQLFLIILGRRQAQDNYKAKEDNNENLNLKVSEILPGPCLKQI